MLNDNIKVPMPTEEKVVDSITPKTILDYGNNYLLEHLLDKYDVNSTLKYAFTDSLKK